MNKQAVLPFAALVSLCVGVMFGQSSLTDSEVNRAIAQSQGRQGRIGLVLIDKQTGLLSAMACPTCAVSGYVIHVYTPEQWIRQMAAHAHSELLPFTANDVTPEMRQRSMWSPCQARRPI